MDKTMRASPLTDRIYYGMVKNDEWVGEKEDVTDMAIRAVFECLMNKHKKECPDGVYSLTIRFPGIPYVLSMNREGKKDADCKPE